MTHKIVAAVAKVVAASKVFAASPPKVGEKVLEALKLPSNASAIFLALDN